MKRIFAVLVLLMAVLAGWMAYSRSASQTVSASSQQAPDQVAADFYTAYLESIGDPATGEFHNPMVEKTYRKMPQLNDAFVKEIDAALEGEERIAYDPFLCAQDIPQWVEVKAVQASDKSAAVTVETSFADHQFIVMLDLLDEGWKITAIQCGK